MTLGKLIKIMKDNNIPDEAVLLSDSGWECGATDMDGIWYSESTNVVIFKQGFEDNFVVIEAYEYGEIRDAVRLMEGAT